MRKSLFVITTILVNAGAIGVAILIANLGVHVLPLAVMLGMFCYFYTLRSLEIYKLLWGK